MEIKNKKRDAFLPLLLAFILVAGILIGVRFKHITSEEYYTTALSTYCRSDKISQVISLVKLLYVDSVSNEMMEEDAIKGILSSLDPHSSYLSIADFETDNEYMQGKGVGIGINYEIIRDTIKVVNVQTNSSSEKVGILPGDNVLMINDTLIAGVNKRRAHINSMLDGKLKSKVKLGIKRKGKNEILDFIVFREVIPIYSVDASYMISDNIGYVKLNMFAKTTLAEFIEAAMNLEKTGMTKLIIDLRDNPGGYVDQALSLVELFVEKGKLILYTDGRVRDHYSYYARGSKMSFLDTDLVLLIDNNTVSASEIVAGAIQDNDRGVIIGQRSFGKGLVQEQHRLIDGSILRLTVARYYTPTGRCIQTPYELGNGSYDGNSSAFNQKDFFDNDTMRFITSAGRVLYGGGGIMPDVYIPVDTSFYSPYYANVLQKKLIIDFALEYITDHWSRIGQMTEYSAINNYLSNKQLINSFIEYAAANGIVACAQDIKTSGKHIENMIKVKIIQSLIGVEKHYEALNSNDDVVKTAVNLLKNEHEYSSCLKK